MDSQVIYFFILILGVPIIAGMFLIWYIWNELTPEDRFHFKLLGIFLFVAILGVLSLNLYESFWYRGNWDITGFLGAVSFLSPLIVIPLFLLIAFILRHKI